MSDQPGRLVITGLTCLTVGALCFVAFLITATRELIRNHQERHMTYPPTPRETIAAALDDWWITTDPGAQFHAPDVAAHVDLYLGHYGYVIHPGTQPETSTAPRPPHIAFGILSGLTAATTIQAAYQGHWWWIASAVLAIHAAALAALVIRRDRRRDATDIYDR